MYECNLNNTKTIYGSAVFMEKNKSQQTLIVIVNDLYSSKFLRRRGQKRHAYCVEEQNVIVRKTDGSRIAVWHVMCFIYFPWVDCRPPRGWLCIVQAADVFL